MHQIHPIEAGRERNRSLIDGGLLTRSPKRAAGDAATTGSSNAFTTWPDADLIRRSISMPALCIRPRHGSASLCSRSPAGEALNIGRNSHRVAQRILIVFSGLSDIKVIWQSRSK